MIEVDSTLHCHLVRDSFGFCTCDLSSPVTGCQEKQYLSDCMFRLVARGHQIDKHLHKLESHLSKPLCFAVFGTWLKQAWRAME